MTMTRFNDNPRCTIDGCRVEVTRLSSGRYQAGIDGWLAGTFATASEVLAGISEAIRMRRPHDPSPAVPDEFRSAVAAL